MLSDNIISERLILCDMVEDDAKNVWGYGVIVKMKGI